VLVRGAAGHFLCGFQGGGEVAQPFDVHLVAVAQFFAADLRQASSSFITISMFSVPIPVDITVILSPLKVPVCV
jgi:hypothetical protein